MARLRIVVVVLLLLSCVGVTPILDCTPAAGITPVCGLTSPEDLVALPGGEWLVVSQSRRGEAGGSLAAVPVGGGAARELFTGVAPGGRPFQRGAISPACPGRPGADAFAPLGIDLGPDGTRLYAINHGGRETVEVFEVGTAGGIPLARWVGCVPVPGDAWLNDLAALPDGGFVASNMLPRGGLGRAWAMLRMLVGGDTGELLEWSPEAGWREIPGTRGSAPNGVAVSADGDYVFFALMGSSEVVRVRRRGDPAPIRVEIARPDNLSWMRDGRLLVASHRGSVREMSGCRGLERGTCPLGFGIVAVDPETLELEELLTHAGPPIGAVSVAVEVGDALFLGTFAGDRIARLARPKARSSP